MSYRAPSGRTPLKEILFDENAGPQSIAPLQQKNTYSCKKNYLELPQHLNVALGVIEIMNKQIKKLKTENAFLRLRLCKADQKVLATPKKRRIDSNINFSEKECILNSKHQSDGPNIALFQSPQRPTILSSKVTISTPLTSDNPKGSCSSAQRLYHRPPRKDKKISEISPNSQAKKGSKLSELPVEEENSFTSFNAKIDFDSVGVFHSISERLRAVENSLTQLQIDSEKSSQAKESNHSTEERIQEPTSNRENFNKQSERPFDSKHDSHETNVNNQYNPSPFKNKLEYEEAKKVISVYNICS